MCFLRVRDEEFWPTEPTNAFTVSMTNTLAAPTTSSGVKAAYIPGYVVYPVHIYVQFARLQSRFLVADPLSHCAF